MPKKSTKSRSKRVSLRTKHKILRKVKEHKKKQAKELKSKLKRGNKKQKLTAAVIPNEWPFKEQLVNELEAQQQREEAEKERKKEEKKAARVEKRNRIADGTFEAVKTKAERQAEEFAQQKKERAAIITQANDPDGSRRAFYREFMRVVDASDVIIHVLDARDPLGCRCVDVERHVLRKNPNKKIVLLLNKIDLVPRENVQAWLKYLRGELPTVAFKCATAQGGSGGFKQRSLTETKAGVAGDGSSGESLGADTLLQLLKNYARNRNIKTAITVGIVGFPNVGKSSLINSLLRTRAVSTGATPGLTRVAQEIHLDKHVKLLDSPGIVYPSADQDGSPVAAALRHAVKLEKLPDPITPVQEILNRCPIKKLMEVYATPRFSTVTEFLKHVATHRGKLKKGGTVDLEAAARLVLHDWSIGKIPYFTAPPERAGAEHEAAEVVAGWGAEFNAEEVFRNESSAVIAGLPAMEDSMYIETPSTGEARVDMGAMEAMAGPSSSKQPQEDMDASDAEEEEEEEAERPSKRSRGNVDLYADEGIYNPKKAKEAKKQAAKQKKFLEELAGEEDEDYEFETDFTAGGATVDDEDEDEDDEDDEEGSMDEEDEEDDDSD